MATQLERAQRFQSLHARPGAFVIPNPWDIGSAALLAGLGYEALATTSAGFANARGRMDGEITQADAVAHCREIASATALPVSADLENCFADEPRAAARTLTLAAEAGVVGGSIEDYDPAQKRIYDFNLAVERVQAAVEAVRTLPFPFTLTARAENLLRGVNDMEDTIRRLQAYEAAGADVVYAPGLATLDQIRKVTSSVRKPVNVLGVMVKGATVQQLGEAGAKRISIGGGLANVAVAALVRSATELRDRGTFDWIASGIPSSEIRKIFQAAPR
jgi:2-methylisocitrate lyase-like PEP mutase family enzyme